MNRSCYKSISSNSAFSRPSRRASKGNRRHLLSLVLSAFALLVSSVSNAALVGATVQVTDLRVEGGLVFVGYGQSIGTCPDRMWLDLSTDKGKGAYALSMLAFPLSKSVYVRAYEEDTRLNGACAMYDIYMTQ